MALGRRASRSVRMVLAVVDGIIDPAVDVDKSDLEKYFENDFDENYLKIKTGCEPTYFTIKPLTRRQKDAIDVLAGQRNIASWYIRCGLKRLENYKIYSHDGGAIDAPQPVIEDHGDIGHIATEKWLDEVSFTIDVRDSLFVCIHQLTEAKVPLLVRSDQESGVQK